MTMASNSESDGSCRGRGSSSVGRCPHFFPRIQPDFSRGNRLRKPQPSMKRPRSALGCLTPNSLRGRRSKVCMRRLSMGSVYPSQLPCQRYERRSKSHTPRHEDTRIRVGSCRRRLARPRGVSAAGAGRSTGGLAPRLPFFFSASMVMRIHATSVLTSLTVSRSSPIPSEFSVVFCFSHSIDISPRVRSAESVDPAMKLTATTAPKIPRVTPVARVSLVVMRLAPRSNPYQIS